MKIVVVGGVAGGASAAARIRRRDERAEIIMFERGEYISYANCGLPYYIGGEITDKADLTVQTPDRFRTRFHVDVRTMQEVTSVDTANKTVSVLNHNTGETYTESYDKLVLSPGAKPIVPPIDGIDSKRVFTLRSVPDTFAIKEFIDNSKPKQALMLGGGPIGLEVAEAFVNSGVKVSVVDSADHVFGPLDYDMAVNVHAYLRSKGVDLRLNNTAASIEETNDGLKVSLQDDVLNTDFVLVSIGVQPDTDFLKGSNIVLGHRNSIPVNSFMQTNIADVYAIGDACETISPVTGTLHNVPLAGAANKQASVVANHITGLEIPYRGTVGTSIVRFMDLIIAVTGANETALKSTDIDYDKTYLVTNSHAGYYPGAMPIILKVLFEKQTGKILGGQMIGYEGVDKRIDVLSVALFAKLTGEDLAVIDLAYAPPFSSVKDPVNMVGSVITNITQGLVEQYYWDDVKTLLNEKAFFLDVRDPDEFTLNHINGAINIPLYKLRGHLDELDKAQTIYVYCHSAARSYNACRILTQNGFMCKNLAGGFALYNAAVSDKSILTI